MRVVGKAGLGVTDTNRHMCTERKAPWYWREHEKE